MTLNNGRKFENERQSGSSGHSLNHTNEDSDQNIREEVDSLKQQIKKLESENQLLRAQNEILRVNASDDTLRLIEKYNTRRDSFSDRVCDDLSEVILQFLPIKDKFRFECVDKHFQRTVFQRHYDLFIEDVMRKNLNRFKTIVEKLANIKSLKCEVNLNNEEMEVIIKNCNHLIEFNINLSNNSTEIIKSFADRFGPQLTSITLFNMKSKLNINSMVNIQEIDLNLRFNGLNHLMEFYAQIKPKNLKKICLQFHPFFPSVLHQLSDIQRQYFKTFIDNNKSITHLTIKCDQFSQDIDLNLSSISQLNQLLSLQIQMKMKINIKSLISDLKQIAVNCRKLKSLSLTFYIPNNDLKTNDIMSEVKKIKGLKRLELIIIDYSGDSDGNKNYFINSLKSGFEELTHLTIHLVRHRKLVFNGNSLDYIIINLPKLQKLIVRNPIEVTELTANVLCLLSKLQTLELYIRTDWNKDKDFVLSFEKKILENCRKIKSVKVDLDQSWI